MMKVRLPLSKNHFGTIFCCYAPTLAACAEDSDTFYEVLDSDLCLTLRSDKLIVLGAFKQESGETI